MYVHRSRSVAVLLFAFSSVVAAAVNFNQNGASSSANVRPSRVVTTGGILAVDPLGSSWPPSGLSITGSGCAFEHTVYAAQLMWMIPCGATHVVAIDPTASDATTLVELPASGGGDGFAGSAFDGARYIWCAPFRAGYIMKIDVLQKVATMHSSKWPSMAFIGAVFDGSGVWFAPSSNSQLVRLDPFTSGAPTANVLGAPYLGGSVSQYFAGAIFDGVRVWFAPCSASNALVIDTTKGPTYDPQSVSAWPSGSFTPGACNFFGGAFDGARVWLAPYRGPAFVHIDAWSRSIGAISLGALSSVGVPTTTYMFFTAFFDGARLWFAPVSISWLVSIEPNGKTVSAYRLSTTGYAAPASDGKHWWFSPHNSGTPILKVRAVPGPRSATRSRSRSRTVVGAGSVSCTAASATITRSAASVTAGKSVGTASTSASPSWTAQESPGSHSASPSSSTTRSRTSTMSLPGVTQTRWTPSRSRSTSLSASLTRTPRESPSASPNATLSQSLASRSRSTDSRSVSAAVTVTATRSPLASATATLRPGGAPSRSGIAAAATITVRGLAVVSVVAMPGSAATSSGRLAALLQMLQCASGDAGDDALPLTSHPLRVSIAAAGDGGLLRQYAGMLLGNVGIALLLQLVHAAVTSIACVRRRHGGTGDLELQSSEHTARHSAMAATRFPSLLLPAQLYLMSLVPQAGVALASSGASTSIGVALGVVGLTLCAAANLALWAWVLAATRLRLKVVPPPRAAVAGVTSGSSNAGGEQPSWYDAWLRVESEWELQDASWFGDGSTVKYLRAYGSYFEDFTERAAWWAAFELGVANASSVAAGLTDAIGCAWASWLNVVPCALYVAIVLWLRPHQRRLDFAAAVGGNVLMLAASVCAALAACGVVAPQRVEAVAYIAALGSGIVTAATLAATPAAVLRRRATMMARRRREQVSMNATSSAQVLQWAATTSLAAAATAAAANPAIELTESKLATTQQRQSLDHSSDDDDAGAFRARGRTAEGQALFEELEALLTATHGDRPQAPRPHAPPQWGTGVDAALF